MAIFLVAEPKLSDGTTERALTNLAGADLETAGQIGKCRDLLRLPGGIVTELPRHQIRHLRDHADGGFRVEKQSTCAAGEDVFHAASHLLAGGPDDFRGYIWEIAIELFAQFGGFRDKRPDGDGIRPMD